MTNLSERELNLCVCVMDAGLFDGLRKGAGTAEICLNTNINTTKMLLMVLLTATFVFNCALLP